MDKKTIFKIVVIMALILFALTIFPFLTQWLGGGNKLDYFFWETWGCNFVYLYSSYISYVNK